MSEWRWKHFTKAEMQCRCGCGRCEMVPEFMDKLEALREAFGKPMPVSSGYRCPAHNAAESKTGESGPHTTGRAVDILIRGGDALCLVAEAFGSHAFTGLGVKQHGDHARRFIHLDDLVEGHGPRPWCWSYP